VYEPSTTDDMARLMPMQSAPIDRTPAGAAAFNAQAGVDASFDWGSLISTALPILTSLL
jgi:hypothetical protein